MDQHEVPNYWSGHCFGCSKDNKYGLQLRFWASEQGCFTRCVIPEHMCGIDGIAHGGIIALLLDEVAAWTIIARLNRFGMTREITVRYLEPVRTDTEILAEAQIIKNDQHSALLTSRLWTAGDILTVESESNWVLPKPSRMAKMLGVDEAYMLRFLAKYSRFKEEASS
ncbi:PaaI family thioesterase [Chloroflexota bacterium]